MTPARASEPFDHPKRHAHAVIEALVLYSGAVAQVLDQPVLLTRRCRHAHDVPAVDQLLLDLVLPGLDAHRRFLGTLHAARRGRNLGERLELGRLLLRGERERESEQREGEDSARHGASLSFWDNARQASRSSRKLPWKKRCCWSTGRRICTAPSMRCPTCATPRASPPARFTAC